MVSFSTRSTVADVQTRGQEMSRTSTVSPTLSLERHGDTCVQRGARVAEERFTLLSNFLLREI